MITRWRIEAESPDKEEVEEDVRSGSSAFLTCLRLIQPEVQWECTDEHGPEPVERSGEAVFYMRRVFKVWDADEDTQVA